MVSLLIFLLFFFLLFSAFMSASETALFSLSYYTQRTFEQSEDRRKKLVAHLLNHPKELLVTILMLNICCNILVQNVVSNLFGGFPGWLLKVGVPLALTLFLGEIIPKSVSLPYNIKIATTVSPLIYTFARFIGPIRMILIKITNYISRVMFFFLKKEKPFDYEELRHILYASQQKGIVREEEMEFVGGYLHLRESSVKELMRPREEILFYDINEDLEVLYRLFSDKKCSRIPICQTDVNDVKGILSIYHFFLHADAIKTSQDLIPYLDKPYFIPESTDAWLLFEHMRQENESIALVVDEYGSVTGLISQEDLVEEVIGEIKDWHDVKEHYTRCGPDIVIASGKMELEEFKDVFGIELKTKSNMVTLGGWLSEQLEDIPQAGIRYVTDQFLFYVLTATPSRVKRIYVRRLRKPKKGGL